MTQKKSEGSGGRIGGDDTQHGCFQCSAVRVQSAAVRDRFEAFGQSDDGLGCTEHQITVTIQILRQTVKNADLRRLVEIDEHVAAEHHVEYAELRKIADQVKHSKLYHRANVGSDLPIFVDLLEILEQQHDRQPALYFELAVNCGSRSAQSLVGNVGCEDLDLPSGQPIAHFFDRHRERIGLLAGGGGSTPDANPAAVATRRDEPRNDRVAKVLEW